MLVFGKTKEQVPEQHSIYEGEKYNGTVSALTILNTVVPKPEESKSNYVLIFDMSGKGTLDNLLRAMEKMTNSGWKLISFSHSGGGGQGSITAYALFGKP